MIVLDASLVGPLGIPDEAGDISEAALKRLFATSLHVPMHWRLEVANMLRSAVRRQRITIAQRNLALARIELLPVTMDRGGWETTWGGTLALSDRHGLTPYDAAYIELAQRLAATLATRDRKLSEAARAERLNVTDLA